MKKIFMLGFLLLISVPLAIGGTGYIDLPQVVANSISLITALGDTVYGGAAGVTSRLAGNITSTKKYLSQTGTGAVSAAPTWAQLAVADLSDGSIGTGAVVRAISPTITTGLSSPAFISTTANPATAGIFELAKTDLIEWRNNANNGNATFGIDSSNNLTIGGSMNGLNLAGSPVSGVTSIAMTGAITGNTAITTGNVISSTANPATAGIISLAKTDLIEWRNNANSGNATFGIDSSNNLTIGGSTNGLNMASSPISAVSTFNASGAITLTGISTGTNADFLCLSAGGVVLLQSSACTISSRRFKEDIRPLGEGEGLTEIMHLRAVEFRMKEGEKANKDVNYRRLQAGLIAEDVAQVDTRLVVYEQDMVTPKSYRQEGVIAVLVKAMQEQQVQIRSLQEQIQYLRGK